MSEQVFTFPYYLGDKSRLFDLGQGIHTSTNQILQKRGGKVQPFTRTLGKMKLQALLFAGLVMIQALLMSLGGVSVPKIVLAAVCALFGGIMWAVWKANNEAFEKTRALYLEVNGEGGTLTIDENGITECSDAGVETHFDWEDYRCCVMCEEAIVVVSFKPVMLIVSRREETEDGLLSALAAFDKLDTVYDVEIQEKKK